MELVGAFLAVNGSKWGYTGHCNRYNGVKDGVSTKIGNLLIAVTYYTALSVRYTNFDTFTVLILSQLIFFQGKLNTSSRTATNLYEGSLIIKTNKCTNMCCIILKHTLKHLKAPTSFDL
jgi:hypothetical protein